MTRKAYGNPYTKRDLESSFDGATARFRKGGALALRISKLSEPTARESVATLEAIREASKLPLATIAALLGTSHCVVQSWIDGRRMPSGTARRAIWLLHRLVTSPEKPFTIEDWLAWQ